MGSCASTHKNPDSTMKLFSITSKADKILIPSSTEEKPVNGELGFKSQSSPRQPSLTSFRDFGSKEENFFDSQPWLESDCEDDYFSVNGDTPSRGNTPKHQSGFVGAQLLNKPISMDGAAGTRTETSPTDKKKKLAELFRESFSDDQDAVNQSISNGILKSKPIILDLPPRSSNGTPDVSGLNSVGSSERTPDKDFKLDKEKSARVAQCCLPSFVRSRSFSDRKKTLSPGPNGGGQQKISSKSC
ncbi:uncharacterized protein At3g27210-like isoform X2 [Telopea speciosissima]|uniref:uncharacterized protein At3g27210-like isoform X2 n=1 Tax=Telopea speciosissima TaxID=54955 RepID=UPI001CC490B4|nr:uncharacterized protein At3g27210-like isoform X2 [Telopea speciosissima]